MESSSGDLEQKIKPDTEHCEVDMASYQTLLHGNNIADQRIRVSIEFINIKYRVPCKKGE